MIYEFEKPKIPENNLLRLPFGHFLDKVYPDIKGNPEIKNIVAEILLGLQPLNNIREKGIFAYIKKGAMRRFSLENGNQQDDLIKTFNNLTPEQIGDDPDVQDIVAQNFSGVMDLDIRLDRIDPKNRTIVYETILNSLLRSGFMCESDQNKAELTNGKYQAQVTPIIIESYSGRTKWAIDLYQTGVEKPLFKIDIIDFPQENSEYKSSVNDIQHTSDLDQILGYLGYQNEGLDFYYETKPDKLTGQPIPIMKHLLDYHYFENLGFASNLSTQITQNLFRGSRQIAYRVMYPDPITWTYPLASITDLVQEKNKSIQNGSRFFLKDFIPKWIDHLKDYIDETHKYLISCQLGLSSGNIIGLPLYWYYNHINLTPLGRIIKTPQEFEKLTDHMLSQLHLTSDIPLWCIAQEYNDHVLRQHDGDKLAGLLLIDGLKDMRKIRKNLSRSLSTVGDLFDPLLLLKDRWKDKFGIK